MYMSGMSQSEYDELLEAIRKRGELVSSSKEAAREFLVNLGVLTPDGRLTERFKDLQLYGPNKDAVDVRY
jgi:hypothetical protein